MTKVVINDCFGGFGLSDAAYEKLAEWGIPVRKYIAQKRDEQTGRYLPEPANDGEVIFDRELTGPGEDGFSAIYHRYKGAGRGVTPRYWDNWLDRHNRSHPLLVRLVEEMGEAANGDYAELKIVEVPDDAEWEIEEYDGNEHVAEKHRTWD
jgi:hypothetical protein